MFYNNRITIYSRWEDRKLVEVYTDIKAQIYKRTIRLDRSIAENTSKEVMIIMIDADKTNVREWHIIRYIDDFGMSRELKANAPEMVKALYFKNLIQIQCDLA